LSSSAARRVSSGAAIPFVPEKRCSRFGHVDVNVDWKYLLGGGWGGVR
jgi:hypothetical protein